MEATDVTKEDPALSAIAAMDADVASVAEKYHSDLAHGRHVASLALALFDALEPRHRMGETDRTILRHAALLHDIGYFVAARGHHRHGAYLVAHDARLRGYPQPERELLSHVVRNHRKKPRPGPNEWSRSRRAAFQWLSGLLRAADALDWDHRQEARIAGVEAGERGYCVRVTGLDPDSLGMRLREKAGLLAELLDGSLRFRRVAP